MVAATLMGADLLSSGAHMPRIAFAADFGGVSGADSLDSAADEILRRMTKEDAEKPSEDDGDEPEDTNDEESEDTSDDSPEEDEESEDDGEDEDEESEDEESDDEPEAKKTNKKVVLEADADAYVKAKIDGQEREISIKDLTRLYGQEASLTRKSQEAAELKKAAETNGAKYVAGIESLLQRANARWEPYSKINFLALTKDPDVSPDELAALHAEATAAYQDVNFFQQSLDAVVKDAETQRQTNLVTQAREAVKTLSDPKTGIPNWSEKLYNDIRQFAVSSGLDARAVNEIVDPSAIKLLHMAMQFSKGQQAAQTTKKVTKSPKRILKGEPEVVSKKVKGNSQDNAYKKLVKSGSLDDATDLILARMGVSE